MKVIQTKGIIYLERLSDTDEWYCGTDYRNGDLYEAEEIFRNTGNVKPNRIVFIHHPDGALYEPLILNDGQYFGRPVQILGVIYILLVDFNNNLIRIVNCGEAFEQLSTEVELSLSTIEDCYNLVLRGSPLMLTRSGEENRFQIVWPEKAEFAIEPNEAFLYREGAQLVFSQWHEDPDYREEVLIREYPSGILLKRLKGSVFIPPSGETWILE